MKMENKFCSFGPHGRARFASGGGLGIICWPQQSDTSPYWKKAKQLLPKADESLLSGTSGTIYLKQLGHRQLSGEDSEKIIQTLGSDEDRIALKIFSQAQQVLSERLQKTKGIGLILEQAGVNYHNQRRRIAKPEMWKAEEMISVIDVSKRLQV